MDNKSQRDQDKARVKRFLQVLLEIALLVAFIRYSIGDLFPWLSVESDPNVQKLMSAIYFVGFVIVYTRRQA